MKEIGSRPCKDNVSTCDNIDLSTPKVEEKMYYITCSECNNGYVAENVPGFNFRGYYKDKSKDENKRFWSIPSSTICVRC